MADYAKQTVAQLRQLLKERSIPSTGLQRKAQIVEKLEEWDKESAEAPEPESDSADAPPEPVQQVAEGAEGGVEGTAEEAPALEEVGEPQPQTTEDASAPVQEPPLTADRVPETVSHIDSAVPPPDEIKSVDGTAEDTTEDRGASGLQPTAVFNAPPADPEDVVGPRVTEPADPPRNENPRSESGDDELPEAPGPAAEALRFARQESASGRGSPQATVEGTQKEAQSVEKVELLPIPERSTAETSRLNTEELEADSRKRKRRSQTPELPSQDIRAKKARASAEGVAGGHLKEDTDTVMEQRRPEDNVAEVDTKREKRENVSRYKDLVTPAKDTQMDAINDDRPTVPALHPVTSALYIRNFMRPLRQEALRAHIVALAHPPSSASHDESIVKSLFLDSMKTHAFALLASTTAASRVRASLHGSIWPPEVNRKDLWVDFIPEDRLEVWVKEEEDAVLAEKEARKAGRSSISKRFEVVYPESGDGSISAVFQEVGSGAPANAPRGPRGSMDVRRPSTQTAPTAAPSKETRHDIEASFKTLDELFRSTEAKPHLYYLPVSDEIAETRLKELDGETSRDWAPGEVRKGRGIKFEQKYKYCFDEDDRLVELGEDRGPWTESFRGGRGGGFRGGRGGRGGVGYRGRGGDTWRG